MLNIEWGQFDPKGNRRVKSEPMLNIHDRRHVDSWCWWTLACCASRETLQAAGKHAELWPCHCSTSMFSLRQLLGTGVLPVAPGDSAAFRRKFSTREHDELRPFQSRRRRPAAWKTWDSEREETSWLHSIGKWSPTFNLQLEYCNFNNYAIDVFTTTKPIFPSGLFKRPN